MSRGAAYATAAASADRRADDYRTAATANPFGTVAYLDAALRKARAERMGRGGEEAGLQHVGRALDGVLARLEVRFAA